jgi:hypothetical protein
MLIAMEQITDRRGYPDVFRLDTGGERLEIYGEVAEPSDRWNAEDGFVFRFRKLKS